MNKKDLVYKSNELIEAKYALSAASQKVAAVLISKIDPQGGSLPVFDLSVSEYAKLMGVHRNSVYENIDKTTTELKQVVITLRSPIDRSFTKLSLFSKCTFNDVKKRVFFTFENELDRHLRALAGNFTKYQVKQIQVLNSRYAIRLYEILRRHHPMKVDRAISYISIKVDHLKDMLGAKNQKTYDRFFEFKRHVLTASQKELSEKTDLVFDFVPVKTGHKVTSIDFAIKHNKKFQRTKISALKKERDDIVEYMAPDNVDVDKDIAQLVKMAIPGISTNQLKNYFLFNEPCILRETAKIAVRAISDGIEISNKRKYFEGILKKIILEWELLKNKKSGNDTRSALEELTDVSWADSSKNEIY